MNFDKFTIKSQKAVNEAIALSQRSGCQAIETGHLLTAIMKADENITNFIFRKLNWKPSARVIQKCRAATRS